MLLFTSFVNSSVYASEPTGKFPESETEQENTSHIKWYRIEGGHYFRSGGINKLDGVIRKTKEETVKLEEELRKSNYVLVNSENRDISDEEYNLLAENCDLLSVGNWILKENGYHNTYYKVYIYKPIYYDIIYQLKTEGKLSSRTAREETGSTVVVNYAEWYHRERVGKIVNEFNDNIPDWYTTGFLLITSPIDICITFEFTNGNYYNRLYVKANEDFLVEVITGGYIVKSINNTSITWDESSLIYNNNIQVTPKHTKDNPKELNIETVVKKYNIPSLEDIENKPDYSWANRHNIPATQIFEEETELKVTNKGKEKNNTKTLWSIIFICAFILMTSTGVVVYKYYRKRYSHY